MTTKLTSFSILTEPRGETYAALIRVVSARAKTFGLVVRPGLGMSAAAEAALRRLEPFLLLSEEAMKWPGTFLIDESATVFEYESTEITSVILSQLANGLYEWKQPELPEDLFFRRGDRSTLLESIAHEETGSMYLDTEEFKAVTTKLPRLRLVLHENK